MGSGLQQSVADGRPRISHKMTRGASWYGTRVQSEGTRVHLPPQAQRTQYNPTAFTLILSIAVAWALLTAAATAWAHGEMYPSAQLEQLFPDADSFTFREFHLEAPQIKEFEEKLGVPLKGYDRFPRFYFVWGMPEMGADHKMSEEEHAKMRLQLLGVIYFVDLTKEEGVHVQGAIVVDTKGKIMKMAVFDNDDRRLSQYDAFLQAFVGKGIDDPLRIGNDIDPPDGDDERFQDLALEARKTLLLFHASFAKKR